MLCEGDSDYSCCLSILYSRSYFLRVLNCKWSTGGFSIVSSSFSFIFLSLSTRSVAEKEAVPRFTDEKTVSHPPDMSGWNPFGEDNFSKLTEEELLDREFDLLRSSKGHLKAYFASQ